MSRNVEGKVWVVLNARWKIEESLGRTRSNKRKKEK